MNVRCLSSYQFHVALISPGASGILVHPPPSTELTNLLGDVASPEAYPPGKSPSSKDRVFQPLYSVNLLNLRL